MDIISLQKANKAKREMNNLSNRIGAEVQDIYANAKERLEALEAKRIGSDEGIYTIQSDEKWKDAELTNVSVADGVLTGKGTWIGDIELEDAVQLEKVSIQTKVVPEGEYTALIPSMTSNTAPAPLVVTQSSGTGYSMFSDVWRSAWRGSPSNSFVTIDLGEEKLITQYSMSTGTENTSGTFYADRMPGSWRFEGSNDGNTWNVIDAQTATTSDWGGYRDSWFTAIVRTFNFSNSIKYRYYRFYFEKATSSAVTTLIIGRTQLYEMAETLPIFVENDFTSAVIYTDTGEGFVPIGEAGSIESKFNKKFKVKIEAPTDKSLSLTKLSILYKSKPINTIISETEKKTAINLNKHNLRVSALLNQSRYKLTDMIVDDFRDQSGVDKESSINVTYDEALHKYTGGAGSAELITIAEVLDAKPTFVVVAQSGSVKDSETYVLDLTKGTFENTELVDGSIQLKRAPAR
ncbi:discoidin domain-containing protein (plasmid) [Paenibacillus urinalis]|uniref:Discoidin domain-containing protein n=1 Tax=Paenibacillus urinalis TaxID=521520 RepID=A0ABY7XGZ7_9BACL|nr:discoidin domain-containing protein [Paenibacillus urinalis]WDI05107.1 discoidin domain-containing protein [Paenibacillus urinalis]